MQNVGLIGDPVDHSRSPVMQNAAFVTLGIDAEYVLWQTPLARLTERVATLRAPNYLGANVTIPHKEAVMPLLDVLDQSAFAVGAVNTIVTTADGLVGHNTDAAGLIDALREEGKAAVDQAMILGAGGAARAAAAAVAQLGATRITVASRRSEQACALVEVMAVTYPECHWQTTVLPDDDGGLLPMEIATSCDLLINATPIGMTKMPGIPLGTRSLQRLSKAALVVDLVTQPTRLLHEAAMLGFATMNGLPMLLHQGALAFTLWTNQGAPLGAMRAALLDGISIQEG